MWYTGSSVNEFQHNIISIIRFFVINFPQFVWNWRSLCCMFCMKERVLIHSSIFSIKFVLSNIIEIDKTGTEIHDVCVCICMCLCVCDCLSVYNWKISIEIASAHLRYIQSIQIMFVGRTPKKILINFFLWWQLSSDCSM